MSVYRTVTERVFQDYFEPAGVSAKWLNHLRIMVQQADDWPTGSSSGPRKKPNTDAVVYRRAMAAPFGLPARTARQI